MARINEEKLFRLRALCASVIGTFNQVQDAVLAAHQNVQDVTRDVEAALRAADREPYAQLLGSLRTTPPDEMLALVPPIPEVVEGWHPADAAPIRQRRRNVVALVNSVRQAVMQRDLLLKRREALDPRFRAILAFSNNLEKLAREYQL